MAEEETLEVWHHEQVELCAPKIGHPMGTGGASIGLRDGRILFVYSSVSARSKRAARRLRTPSSTRSAPARCSSASTMS